MPGPVRSERPLEEDAGRLTSERAEAVLGVVRAVAAELHGDAVRTAGLGLADSLEEDFGLDSLARLEVVQRLESGLRCTISEQAIAEAETPADLVAALTGVMGMPASRPRISIRQSGPVSAEVPATLSALLRQRAREVPDRTYIELITTTEATEPIRFGGLDEAARRAAAVLRFHGLQPGDRLGIMLPTCEEFFIAFFGALYAAAVPVPLYPPARRSQLEAHMQRTVGILRNCGAELLIVPAESGQPLQWLATGAFGLKKVLPASELRVGQAAPEAAAADPGQLALLQYTSGSTGQPKGVMLTHTNILANIAAMRAATGSTAQDCFVSWLPLYHDMGLIGAALGALVVGYPLVLMSPFHFLARPVRWLRAIQDHRATLTAAPNFAYEVCVSRIPATDLEGLDLSSLRLMANGAESVSPSTLERFADRFRACGLNAGALAPVYGLAEAVLGVCFSPPGRGARVLAVERRAFLTTGVARPAAVAGEAPLRFVSCGRALPAHAVRIVDAAGAELPERQQGQIQFRGLSATTGYFGNAGATAELLAGAWRNTGDLGFLADSELYVTGRSKDVIIRGGRHIHPQELEEAVGALPGIRKGCVVAFAARDQRGGTERLVVVAETRLGERQARARLLQQINRLSIDLLGTPADRILLAPARTIPKTPSGKLRRAACAAAFEEGTLLRRLRPGRLAWVLLWATARGLARRATRAVVSAAWLAWLVVAGLPAALGIIAIATLVPGAPVRRALAGRTMHALFTGIGLRPRAEGTDLDGVARPIVLVTNHSSYLDSLLLAAVLPRDFVFVAKRELGAVWWLGWFLRRMGTVLVERFDVSDALAAADSLSRILQEGSSLAVFPEGTFHRESGLLPFHLGAFAAAAGTGAMVVPAGIRGSRFVLPDGSYRPRRGPISLRFGPVLGAPGRDWRSMVAMRDQAREWIASAVDEQPLTFAPRGGGPPQGPRTTA